MSIKDRWLQLLPARAPALRRARDAAALTIPSLMVPEGHTEQSTLVEPYQSLGARGVNNLASKLLLALMPPATPFFRLSMSAAAQAEVGAKKTDVEEALRKIEAGVMQGVERSNLRTVMHGALRQLVACGNALLYLPDNRKFRSFPLDHYVTMRSPDGTVTETIVQEPVNPATLPESVQAATKCDETHMQAANRKIVEIYTHVRLDGDMHKWHQEINEIEVPGSQGQAKVSESPWIPLRWTAVSNEDYGRGMVEEYIGDLRSLEGLNMAVVSFAAAAAKIMLILKPNSTMAEQDLRKPSGSVIVGDIEDVGVLQMEKFADFQVAKGLIDDLSLRLSHAFLMQSGTVRNAERVTAEEIRAMAQELEDVLGGVYSVLSQELQVPLVNRLTYISTKEKEIPKLPEGSVAPTIVTGFDALGRGHELNKLRAYFADVINTFGEQAYQFIRVDVGMKMFATQHNIDVADVIKTLDEVQAAQQQQMMANVVDKAAGPVATAVAKQATA